MYVLIYYTLLHCTALASLLLSLIRIMTEIKSHTTLTVSPLPQQTSDPHRKCTLNIGTKCPTTWVWTLSSGMLLEIWLAFMCGELRTCKLCPFPVKHGASSSQEMLILYSLQHHMEAGIMNTWENWFLLTMYFNSYIHFSVVVCLSSHLFTMEELSNISTSGWEKRHQQMRWWRHQ